jgi:hypothetical protein
MCTVHKDMNKGRRKEEEEPRGFESSWAGWAGGRFDLDQSIKSIGPAYLVS